MLPLPVALPCLAALVVELDREARLAPVAGAVFIFWPVRCPLPSEILGATVVAVGAGLLALDVEARCVAELDLPAERGIWAEAEAVPTTKTARMRSFFMKIIEVKMRKEMLCLTAVWRRPLVQKCSSAYAVTTSSLPNSLSTRLAC